MSILNFFGCFARKAASPSPGVSKQAFLTKDYKRRWWSLRIPEQWEVTDDPDGADLRGPNLHGIMRVEGFKIQHGPSVTDDHLLAFAAKPLSGDLKPIRTKCGEFVGFYLECEEGDRYYRQWCLVCEPVIIHAIYSCPLKNRKEDDESLDFVIGTLRKTE